MIYDKPKKYEIVETFGKIKRDVTSYGHQFSIEELDAEVLIQDNFDFRSHEGKRVRVIVMIEERE